MNYRQRTVVVIGSITIALMLLFPPFHFVRPDKVEYNLGYTWILSPPAVSRGGSMLGSVNVTLLATQWAAVALIVGGLLFVFNDDISADRSPPPPDAESEAGVTRHSAETTQNAKSPAPTRGAMTGFVMVVLRLLRGLALLVAGLTTVALATSLPALMGPDPGKVAALLLIKIMAITVLGALAWVLRRVANSWYAAKYPVAPMLIRPFHL